MTYFASAIVLVTRTCDPEGSGRRHGPRFLQQSGVQRASRIQQTNMTFVLAAGFNANGIAATPNGRWLVIVQSSTGLLFRVYPVTGVATVIDLDGALVTNGGGILLHDHTLYVVRNSLNRIAVVELDRTLTCGEYVGDLSSPYFRIPTTIAKFGNSLYAVNARFGTPIPGADYEVVRVRKD